MWIPDTITAVKGPVSYLDHIRLRTSSMSCGPVDDLTDVSVPSGNESIVDHSIAPSPLRRSTQESHPPDRLTY